MRLRDRRAVHARRRSNRWRFAVTGGLFALLVGAACLAPLAPSALAPTAPSETSVQPDQGGLVGASSGLQAAPVQSVGIGSIAQLAAVVPAVPAPTARPTLVPTPLVLPTLGPSGLAVLNSIRSDRTAQWVKNHTETPLRSGPAEDSAVFTRLPQWTLLKQLESRPDWLMVQYSGDGRTRQAGPGWVKASDVGAVDAPTVWLSAARIGPVWSAPDASGRRLVDVPTGTVMEVIGSDFIHGTRVHVRLPGNGRSVPPSEGWIDGDTVARAPSPSPNALPWAYPDDLRADVRINVPYRTQLDGSNFASANCGPTVLGMALESFGVNMAPPDLRGQVLNTENFDPSDTDAGSYIWALANVAQEFGVDTHGLYQGDGALHRWTADDLRASLRRGQPVIVQVIYRGLPGREDSGYYGDHYIIITGLLGDKFLYNDPIGGAEAHEAPGYDRVMTAAQLQRAMHASDSGYAFTAFSLSRN